jgi:Uma2 family endonuclease
MGPGLATYADAAVIRGEPERDPKSPTHVTNPSVIVEVLSPSTEDYDRGEKREHYQQIESLREYVLVAQDRRWVEVFQRTATGSWESRAYGPGAHAEIPSLRLRLSVDEVYDVAGIKVP